MSRRAKFRSETGREACDCHKTTATQSTYSSNYRCLYEISEDLSPSTQDLGWEKHRWPRELGL